jgi:myosin tail region-interacting protein MTI1
MSGADPVSSVPPATPPHLPSANESERENMQRRETIVERMAKLGGIKFGAPLPVNRVQPSGPTQSVEEQARRQRSASTSPPPPIPVRPEEEATPRSPRRDIVPPRQPAAYYHGLEQDNEQASGSDDGVQDEAEESEFEEVGDEDLEDEYDNGGVEGEKDSEDEYGYVGVDGETPVTVVPPPPPRPLIPTTHPPIQPSRLPGRGGSSGTITHVPRPPVRQYSSDFVMVEPEEAPLPSLTLHSHSLVPSHQRSVHPPQESSGPAGRGQRELPSISSGLPDLGTGELSGSMWSKGSTAYPPAVPSRLSISTPPPPLTGVARQRPVGQRSRAPAAVPTQMTSDDLCALWGRVGVYVGEAASRLLERSKRTLVGNGSYEGFIAEALALVPNALPPQSPGEYGILIYAQTAWQVHTRVADILSGDVVVLDAAKLKGHKGLHTYSLSAG